MTREKMKERYERAKQEMEKAKAEMEKYGREMEEADKTEFWRVAQNNNISLKDLLDVIAQKKKENVALVKRADAREAEQQKATVTAPNGEKKEEI